MSRPVLQIAVLLLLIMVGASAHLLAKLIVWQGGLVVGLVIIALLLIFSRFFSRHLD